MKVTILVSNNKLSNYFLWVGDNNNIPPNHLIYNQLTKALKYLFKHVIVKFKAYIKHGLTPKSLTLNMAYDFNVSNLWTYTPKSLHL